MASFNVGASDCLWLAVGGTEYSANNFVIVPAGPPPGMTDASPVIHGQDSDRNFIVVLHHHHVPAMARALQAVFFGRNA